MTKGEFRELFAPIFDSLVDKGYAILQQFEHAGGIPAADIAKFFEVQSEALIKQISVIDVAEAANKLKEGLNGNAKI